MLAQQGAIASSGAGEKFLVNTLDTYSNNPKVQVRNVDTGEVLATYALTDGSRSTTVNTMHIPKGSVNLYYGLDNDYDELWVLNLKTGVKRKVCSWFNPYHNMYVSESRDFAIISVYASNMVFKVRLSDGAILSTIGGGSVSAGVILGYYSDDEHFLTMTLWPDEHADPRPRKVKISDFTATIPNYVYFNSTNYGLDANDRFWSYYSNYQRITDATGAVFADTPIDSVETGFVSGLGMDNLRKKNMAYKRSADGKIVYLVVRSVDSPTSSSLAEVARCYSTLDGISLDVIDGVMNILFGENEYLLSVRGSKSSTMYNFVVCMDAATLTVKWTKYVDLRVWADMKVAISHHKAR